VRLATRGIDVASWQHPDGKAIDWFDVAGEGFTFAMVKATQGSSWLNPWLHRDLEDARGAGLMVGAYHYYEVGSNPEAQADNFVGSLIGQQFELGVWLDWEPEGVQSWEVPQTYTTFVDKVSQTRHPVGTRCSPEALALLRQGNTAVYRLWLSSELDETVASAFLITGNEPVAVPAVPTDCDVVWLTSTRGLNIFTAPSARPTVADVHPIKLEDEPAEPEKAEDDVEL